MSATAPAPQPVSSAPAHTVQEGSSPWVRLLAWSVGVVIAVDVILMVLIGFPVPFLAAPVLLSLGGLWLLRRNERAGVIMLGVLAALGLLLYGPNVAEYLRHPESGIDFFHTAVAAFGRVVTVVAAVAALRRGPGGWARRLAIVSAGLLAALFSVALVATLASGGEEAQPGDVTATLDDAAFPEDLTVNSGDTLHLDNTDPFRHTFTVEGTDIDVELPALQGVRIPIDLDPGTYALICAIPGHEFMDTTLTVR